MDISKYNIECSFCYSPLALGLVIISKVLAFYMLGLILSSELPYEVGIVLIFIYLFIFNFRRKFSGRFNASLHQVQLPKGLCPFLVVISLFRFPLHFQLHASHSLSSGYTVAWLPSRGPTSLLAAGAPRYQHVGRVLLFQESKDGRHWSQVQKIEGTQVSMAQEASSG